MPFCAGVTVTAPCAVLGALEGTDGRDGVGGRDDGFALGGELRLAVDEGVVGAVVGEPEVALPAGGLGVGLESAAGSCVELAETVPEAPPDEAPAFT
ncbi:hypothetical protein [Catenulispora subtropica]|uniref:Uncharacterized protein n=1 Tax=Catenulispora subtropica TaxID=450798 RepID=A0ABP5D0L2_9ACTN